MLNEHPCDAVCSTALANLHVPGDIVRLVSASRKRRSVFLTVQYLAALNRSLAAVLLKQLKLAPACPTRFVRAPARRNVDLNSVVKYDA